MMEIWKKMGLRRKFWCAVVVFATGCVGTEAPPDPNGEKLGSSFECGAGQTMCDGVCKSVAFDPLNCGACGSPCSTGQTCSSGACVCELGLTDCGGWCVNLAADGANCGACGAVCSGGSVCSQGSCTSGCAGGLSACGTSCVNTSASVQHCGACDQACSAGEICLSGLCDCPAEQARCDGTCTNVGSDPNHCGACGSACVDGATCVGGACVGSGSGGTSGDGGAGSGGTESSGGETSSGGEPGSGGDMGSGGRNSSGGAPSSGGANSSGGTPSSGGTSGSGGGLSTGGQSSTGGAPGTGGSTGMCTNVRPTGTMWDEATCDMWASQTSECDNSWMIDNNLCNESCGRCQSSGSGGSSSSGGATGAGGSGTIPDTCSEADSQFCSNEIGTHCGYTFEYWKDQGGGCLTNQSDGFYVEWNNINNLLGRKGIRPGSATHIVTYDADYNPNGNSYLCVYGWSQGPLAEYYIVESWGSWRPPGGSGFMGQVTSDGGTYDIYRTERVDQPSIEGIATFYQYWSVRTAKRSSGTVTVANHFNAWAQYGMPMGSIYEVSMTVEGYQSSGSADVRMVVQ